MLYYTTLHYIMLCYTTLHYITLHHITSHHIVLYYIILYYILYSYHIIYYIKYYIILYYIIFILYYIILYYIILYYIILYYIYIMLSKFSLSWRLLKGILVWATQRFQSSLETLGDVFVINNDKQTLTVGSTPLDREEGNTRVLLLKASAGGNKGTAKVKWMKNFVC